MYHFPFDTSIFRPAAPEPCTSIWDIDDQKSDRTQAESAPLPMQYTQQPYGYTSYANAARQTNQSVTRAFSIARPTQTVNQRQMIEKPVDTQMDLERAEMESSAFENGQWNSSYKTRNSDSTKSTDSLVANKMPAYIPQTSDSAFSLSGSSSSSQYSSMESLNESAQKHLSNPQVDKVYVKPNSELKSCNKDTVGKQIGPDQNNNVLMSKGKVKQGNDVSSVGLVTDESIFSQDKTLDESSQTKDQLIFKPSGRGGFGRPVDKKFKQNSNSVPLQKQSKPIDNIATSKPKTLGCQTIKPSENQKSFSEGGFGRPRTNPLKQNQDNIEDNSSISSHPKFNADKENKINTASKKGGFGKPGSNNSKQTEHIRKKMKPDQQINSTAVQPQSQVFTSAVLTSQTESWDDEIEDFPPDVQQTYSYGVDHVNFPVSKNRTISETEVTKTGKKEIRIKKTETEPKKPEVDIAPNQTLKFRNPENTNPKIQSFTDNTFSVHSGTAVISNVIKSNAPSESVRRLPVLKDLSKSPDWKKPSHISVLENEKNDQVEKAVLRGRQLSPANTSSVIDTHVSGSNQSAVKAENVPVIDQLKVTGKGENVTKNEEKAFTAEDLKQKVEGPQTVICERNPTLEKETVESKKSQARIDAQKPLAEDTKSTAPSSLPSVMAAPNTAGTIPAGLPPHLMQAYLEYLSRTASESSVNGQKLGLMGGTVPGLGMGVPLVPPFGNPMYSPMLPFGMNPLMMNQFLAVSVQAQQQQLTGQLQANGTNSNFSATPSVHQENTLGETGKNIGSNAVKVDNKVHASVSVQPENNSKCIEEVVSSFTDMKIESHKEIGEPHIAMKVKDAPAQSDQETVKSEQREIQESPALAHSETGSEVEGSTKLSLSSEAQSVRVRRPSSKDQTSSLRIPREPSVSSRLHGPQPNPVIRTQSVETQPCSAYRVQSSPKEDDPAVLRMSSAQNIAVREWVEDGIRQIRATLDGDPSVLRFEQKSTVAGLEQMNQYQQGSSRPARVIVDTTDKSDHEKVRGWMGSGSNYLRVIHNTSYKGENTHTDVDIKQTVPNVDPSGYNQCVDTGTDAVSCQLAQNSKDPSKSYTADERRPESNQTVKGRGGFGTPSMPKKPAVTEEIDPISTDYQSQNPARMSFNTKSLSERFAGMRRGCGDGFSARKLPPRLQAQREKNQQVKDMISQLRKETEDSQQVSSLFSLSC